MSKLPDFLIIGAQRAGTTTLYEDLKTHPDIFLPEHKEPMSLCYDDVLRASGRRRYVQLFWPARPNQIAGEASTWYTMVPTYPGVPVRARRVLGRGLKLVYIVREPIARARSHRHLEIGNRATAFSLDDAARNDPRFLDYGRYACQLDPWLTASPPDQFFVLRFEDYIRDRLGWLRRLGRFLGLDSSKFRPLEGKAHNQTAYRPSAPAVVKRYLLTSQWYTAFAKPLIPRDFRRIAARLLLPKAPAEPQNFSPDVLAWATRELASDNARFEHLFATQWPENYVTESSYVREVARAVPSGLAAATHSPSLAFSAPRVDSSI